MIAEAAAIRAACRRFQLGDDLHGANLRRPGDRTAGEGGPQQVNGPQLRPQPAADLRDEVMNEPVRFQATDRRHAYRAVAADAAQIVAQQVHDHDIFGTVLLAVQQLLDACLILGRRGTTRPGALDRPGLDLAIIRRGGSVRARRWRWRNRPDRK